MYLKNRGPLLVDKVRGYFDRLPPWLRDVVTFRVERQKIDSKITNLDTSALESELKQENTDDTLRTNRFLGDGEAGSGNDMSFLPASHPSEVVITGTGQVADVTETVSQTETGLTEGPPLQDGTSEKVGDVWVTKKVEAPTFDDKVFQLTREDLIPKEFRALVPEKLEAHTVDGTAVLPTLGSGEIVKREEQKKVGVKTVSTQSRDMTTPAVLVGQRVDPDWNGATLNLEQKIVPASTTVSQPFGTTDAGIKPIDGTNALQETWKTGVAGFPEVEGQKIDPQWNGAVLTLDKKIVAANTAVTQVFGVTDASVKPIDDVHSLQEVWTAKAGFPVNKTLIFDPELQWHFWRELSVVQAGSAYTMAPLDLDQEDKVIDAKHVLRRIDTAISLPGPYYTYTTSMFTFPAILSYLSFALVALATANRKEPQWTAGIRASFTAPTNIKNLTEFFTSEPTLWPLYSWAPTDIMFKGLSYSLNLGSVLTDTWSNIGVTYAADAYYGNTVDRFSISATSPSASQYVSAIGNEAAIACVVDVYKGLYVRKTSFVILR